MGKNPVREETSNPKIAVESALDYGLNPKVGAGVWGTKSWVNDFGRLFLGFFVQF